MRVFVMKWRLWCVVFCAFVVASCAGTVGKKTAAIELGWVDRSVLNQPEHHQFKTRYDTAAIDQDITELMQSVNSGVDFLVFLGTWCPDSRREVPHFLKITDRCGIESSRVRLYGLDRSKKSADGLTDQYHIEFVPTFVFLKNGTEVGRITEKPHGSLEADMFAILAAAQQK